MWRRIRRMYYRVSWPVILIVIGCGILLAGIMVLPSMMGWAVEMDVQFGIAAVLVLFVLFLTYQR